MFDILIKNAEIVDGTGAPAFGGDIAVKSGRIAVMGVVTGDAERVIDARGLVAAPGFIDIHSHTDSSLFIDPRAQSKITQGITTELCGNCGFSCAPCLDETGRAEIDSWKRKHGIEEDWSTLDEMLSALEKRRIGVNYAALVGHSNLRAAVIGLANREACPDEIEEMKRLLAGALEDGAFGISTGLIYPPSCYGGIDELVELASVAASHGALYCTHLRNEQDELLEAVEEAIQVGARSGASIQISHHKACGRTNWGKVNATLAMIAEAREAGVDVTIDQYPYIAGATSLATLIPGWAHEGGDEALLKRIMSMRANLIEHLKNIDTEGGQVADNGGWSSVVISSVRTDANRRLEGRNIEEIARERGVEPAGTVLDLLSEEKLSVGMIQFSQCEEDVRAVMRSDFAMLATDASARSTDGELSRGKPHPRAFGAFPRVLGRYVRELGVISLEFAVRKMTSMPARKIGITDRGALRTGNWADIVLFDPNTVTDAATYENPHIISRGVRRVLVNGRVAVEDGELTGELAGKVLRRGR